MGKESAPHVGVAQLSVPMDGIEFILSGWSGQGRVLSALASVDDVEGIDRDWAESALRSRARRILLEHIRRDLAQWPKTANEWLPHLPISAHAEVSVSLAPRGRVDWRETSRRFGWPARSFVTRRRHREIADVTVSTLAWTVAYLETSLREITRYERADVIDEATQLAIEAARSALNVCDVPESIPRPDRHDVSALLTNGKPWSHVEPVTTKILRAETDLTWFATQLLAPDPDFRWRLFHLAIAGKILLVLRDMGAKVSWRSPMGTGASSGPNFIATGADDFIAHIWFEADGAHKHYSSTGETSLYGEVSKPVEKRLAAIGTDLAIYLPGERRALLLECKFSSYGSYVARDGYHQAAGYLLNHQNNWKSVWSYVVAPEETVVGRSHVPLDREGRRDYLGITSPSNLTEIVHDFLRGSCIPGES